VGKIKMKIKPRNFLVQIMRLSTKAKAFVDEKKEKNKKLCRGKIREE
jgi:hypothetical protein